MRYLAHIAQTDGPAREQTVKEHSHQAARYAAASLEGTYFKKCAALAALLHDTGKLRQAMQEYLLAAGRGEEVRPGSVIHTFSGLIYLFERYHTENSTKWERLTCEILSYAIGAHHGLFDCVDLNGQNGFAHRLTKDRRDLQYDETLAAISSEIAPEEKIDAMFAEAVEEVQNFFREANSTYQRNGKNIFFQISMLTRLILSAVIYGDRRDTGEFMIGRKANTEESVRWEEYLRFFEEKLSALPGGTELNHVRADISEQCRQAAERAPGIYRLNVPTGAGKTLCSLRYGLAHAAAHQMKRVIFIIPLLSVLDQNAKVIRDYLPDPELVLEHHSNIIHERDSGDEMDPYELLTESWNSAPVIVSTLVQFLTILFSDKTSAVGRMQALCDSVIVLDEVQSLPKKMTAIFNLALNFLCQFCHSTIVLSSATQPCFEELRWPLHLSPDPDLVHLSGQQRRVFTRAGITDCTSGKGMELEECAEFCAERMQKGVSLLLICNTRAEALQLYLLLRERAEQEDWSLYHLSTAMCQQHRLDCMERLKKELNRIQEEFREGICGRRLICVSTSLMEFGVDLSFQHVVRVMAGMDNLAQAVGRCNRGNEYGQSGEASLISLKAENLSMLREIQHAQDSTRQTLEYMKRNGITSYTGEETTREYYRCLYEETQDQIRYPIRDKDGHTICLADLLSNRNEEIRNEDAKRYCMFQPFKTIGELFSVFDQDTTDVLVPYGEGRRWIEELRALPFGPRSIPKCREILRKAKRCTVSLYRWQAEKLDDMGMLFPVLDGRAMYLDQGAYHEEYGLYIPGEQPVDAFIF